MASNHTPRHLPHQAAVKTLFLEPSRNGIAVQPQTTEMERAVHGRLNAGRIHPAYSVTPIGVPIGHFGAMGGASTTSLARSHPASFVAGEGNGLIELSVPLL